METARKNGSSKVEGDRRPRTDRSSRTIEWQTGAAGLATLPQQSLPFNNYPRVKLDLRQ